MRKFTHLRTVAMAVLATLFGAGVLQAAAPLPQQGTARLCMFMVSSCNTGECAADCFNFDPETTPICNPSNLCCNCYL